MIPPGISIFLRLLAERSAHHHGFTSIDTPEPVPEAKRCLFAAVADLHPSLCVGRFVVMIDRARRLTHRLQSVWLSCLFKRCCDTLLSHHLHAFEKRLIIKRGICVGSTSRPALFYGPAVMERADFRLSTGIILARVFCCTPKTSSHRLQGHSKLNIMRGVRDSPPCESNLINLWISVLW